MTSLHALTPTYAAGTPLAEATAAMVILHGRGASAYDILGLAEPFAHPGLAFLAPEAAGNVWYPESFLAPREQNEPWLTSALARIAATVEQSVTAGIPHRRIFLCGFSQGACLSTEFVARHPQRYAGLIAFTGGLIGPDSHDFTLTGSLVGTPALLSTGDPDPHVPYARVVRSADSLSAIGAVVQVRRYPGKPHSVSAPEIAEARALIISSLQGGDCAPPTIQRRES